MNRRSFIPLFLAAFGAGPRSFHGACTSLLSEPRPQPKATCPLPEISLWALEHLSAPVQPVCEPGDLAGRPAAELRPCLRLWRSIETLVAMAIRDHSGLRPVGHAIQPGVIFHELTAAPSPPLHLLAYHFDSGGFRIFRIDRIRIPDAL